MPPRRRAQVRRSQNATITFGQSFTPSYSGGSGSGNWEFCIGGYTGFSGAVGMPTGTDLGGGNYSPSWMPPAAGSYGFYIASNGTGAVMWCAAGGNDWTSGTWTPPSARDYSLFVAQKADSNHTGNANDPIQGWMQVNYSAATLHVVRQNQASVTASVSPNPAALNTTVTFSAGGGSGSGAYSWSGTVSGTGTSVSKSFATPGTYTATVYRQGDSNYNDSTSTSVSVTVNPSLTVNGGTGGGSYSPGSYATLAANYPQQNQRFWYWSLDSGSGTFTDSNYWNSTFRLGSDNTVVSAHYTAVNAVWTGTPSYVSSNTQYTVVVGSDDPGLTAIDFYKNGRYIFSRFVALSYQSTDVYDPVHPTITYSVNFGETTYNGHGSGSFPVTIVPQPTISTQPASQTVTAGASVNFTVAAAPGGVGAGTLAYQWLKNGSAMANGTNVNGVGNATLTINPVQTGDAGTYAVVVSTDPGGSIQSSNATLTVNQPISPPTITQQPQSQSVQIGGNATFTVAAAGTGQLTYQWAKSGNSIAGATGPAYAISSVQSADAGTYNVTVSNAGGSTPSGNATLTVITLSAPAFTTQPANQSATYGSSATFTAVAAGNPTPTYRWQRKTLDGLFQDLTANATYSGVTSATLSVAGVTAEMDLDQFRCIATNTYGAATSNVVNLNDSDGDGAPDATERALGLNPNDPNDVTVRRYQYDSSNQLSTAPEGTFTPDKEGNILRKN